MMRWPQTALRQSTLHFSCTKGAPQTGQSSSGCGETEGVIGTLANLLRASDKAATTAGSWAAEKLILRREVPRGTVGGRMAGT